MNSDIKKSDLINRAQMVTIAREYNLFVSQSTIHLWANSSGFPRAVGKDGRFLLYPKQEYIKFLIRRLREIEELH